MYGGYYDAEGMMVAGVMIVIILLYLAMMGLGLANYIMNALALNKIASRRQIPNPWMAWLPIASDWLIGNIADEYDGRNGIKRKWRVVLLTLSLISIVGLIIMYVAMFAYIFVTALASTYAEPEVAELLGIFVIFYIFLIVLSTVAVTQSFCKAICVYKIFESTVPEKAVKYLLLYLLVPLAGAICLLKCKDKGYPEPMIEPTTEVMEEPVAEPTSDNEPTE